MTRLRKAKLGVFRQHQNTRTISKSQKFKLSENVRPDMNYSKELQQKMKMLDKLMATSRNGNRLVMAIGRNLSQKGIIKI